jgi:SAM-dependent methyltransferase
MLGHIILLIFIILSFLIIFSTPDTVSAPTTVAISPLDEVYVDIVNTYVVDSTKIKQEARLVKEHVVRPHTSVVLGSSTGHLVHELNLMGLNTTGVDESSYMVRHAKDTFQHTFIQGKYNSDILFQEQSLSHVICFDYTMCFISDKPSVFRSVHHWLERGGLFFVHVPSDWNYGSTTKYTSVKIYNTVREKAILDKTYTLNRTVYMETTESMIELASTQGFEVYKVISIPYPSTDQVVVFKSVDPEYL